MSRRISVHGVTKTFLRKGTTPVVALENVSIEIKAGEFVSLLGPSGCGKSTLLRILDGLDPPTEGHVDIGGQRVAGPGLDRAVVFQQFALMPWATVLENVLFALEAKGVPAKERTGVAEAALSQVGLTEFRDAYPRTLSGGMQQRVGIARALSVDPEILLMDEPFGALDALTRNILQDELLTVWERTKKTVVFVTHSIDEAVYLSDRVAIMSARPGRIIEVVPIDIDRSHGPMVRDTVAFSDAAGYIRKRVHGTDLTGFHQPEVDPPR